MEGGKKKKRANLATCSFKFSISINFFKVKRLFLGCRKDRELNLMWKHSKVCFGA